ncbi:MAG TPA: glycosyltransferase [Xenococcaceae cyanobacterium]
MKIAIAASGFLPVIDGVSVSVYQRLQHLSLMGHEVICFCPDYRPLAAIYPNWQDYTGEIFPQVKIISLPSIPAIGLDFERDAKRSSYQIVERELEQFQPDIIHIDEPERQSLIYWRFPGVNYAKQANIPCVSFFHTNYIEYVEDYFPVSRIGIWLIKKFFQRFFARVYNAYNCTLVATQVTQKKIADLGIKNSVRADLLGVDLEKFHPVSAQNNFFQVQYGITNIENKIKIVFIGRLTPDKGWQFTLKAFTQMVVNPHLLQFDLTKIAMIVVGEGEMKPQIQQVLGNILPDLYCLGRVSPDQIPQLLVNSDLLVTTSEKETTGLTILEAAAAGIPAIAPRQGGVIDLIQDGKTGYLYTPQNIPDFWDKLQLLITHPSLRFNMGTQAKQYASQYSWQQTTTNLLQIWSTEIARNRG